MGNPHSELTSDQHRDLIELMARWLPGRRWFAGKGREITEIRISEVATLPGRVAVLNVIIGVHLDGHEWQTYQVPMSLYSEPHPQLTPIGQIASGQWAYDALTDPKAISALLSVSADQAQVDPDLTHQLDATSGDHPTPSLQPLAELDDLISLPARPLGVEQSNTSVVLGDVALVKFFRLLVPGINPDIEVHAALSVARCPNIGQILGWINAGWRDPDDGLWVTGHTAMVQQLIVPPVEGRDLALERVSAGVSFAEEARDLGRATGVVHRDLRLVLPTHILDDQEVSELVDRLHWRLDQAVAVVADLEPLAPALHERINELLELEHPIEVQRVHGDLHLAQVMRADDGWKLLDFEGEPGSTMAARVAPDHALRDVAGMLRSFAYAAAQGGVGRAPREVAAWLQECDEAFLAGYAEAGVGESGDHDAHTGQVILSAYLVDKAAYEAVYEQRNRPDWLPIPMTALVALADRS